VRPAAAAAGVAVSVDVEEWYHSCWVPEYVHPEWRAPLTEELDALLPDLLERFAGVGVRATFFVLGEVARRLPGRVREIVAAGHEVACHGDLHLRANERTPAAFRADVARARDLLEAVTGQAVHGFRAPEWSLRSAGNPRLRVVAELGFRYDSSLVPARGAGSASNPRRPAEIVWRDGLRLLELPPLVWGGRLGLPAWGWCGRCAPPAILRRAVARADVALLVVHPWELVDRPVPGLYTGFARFFHDAGRRGWGERFTGIVAGARTRTLGAIAESVRRAALETPTTAPFEPTGEWAAPQAHVP
jgi:peptidoglycan/xylan/chitin deacetylase (PgdA/CDA1 family)